MVDVSWIGLAAKEVIDGVSGAGLAFDHVSGTGVVLHMLSSLSIDGRFGLTAIGRTAAQAAELFDATREAVGHIRNR